jgi:hypothetical protein
MAFEDFLGADFLGSSGILGLEFGGWKWADWSGWGSVRGLKSGLLEDFQPNISRPKPDKPNEPIKVLKQIQGPFAIYF